MDMKKLEYQLSQDNKYIASLRNSIDKAKNAIMLLEKKHPHTEKKPYTEIIVHDGIPDDYPISYSVSKIVMSDDNIEILIGLIKEVIANYEAEIRKIESKWNK